MNENIKEILQYEWKPKTNKSIYDKQIDKIVYKEFLQ